MRRPAERLRQVARRRGFTLIELGVVVAIVMLFAAMVMPNVVSQKEATIRREAYEDVLRIAQRARTLAISETATYELAYDDAQGQLRLTKIVAARNNEPEERTDAGETELPDGIRGSSFQSDGADTNAGEWTVLFYPDGTSNGGGIEISEGNATRSLLIRRDGLSTLTDGSLPSLTDESWPAGEYETRQ